MLDAQWFCVPAARMAQLQQYPFKSLFGFMDVVLGRRFFHQRTRGDHHDVSVGGELADEHGKR